ncbi:MAG: glycosyltransferase [Anaerolineales bacterium]|nr:MAG: glycosyltransferase [Anaerolineales bacterium]
MRIAVLSASRIPSRTANSIQVMKVCQAFMELGHDVHLWVPGPAPETAERELLEWYGLRRVIPITWLPCNPAYRRYDFAWKAVRAARKWNAGVFYCWPLQAAALSSWMGLPTALEVHDRPQGRFGPYWMKKFLEGKGPRRILPITQAISDWLAATYELPLEPPFCVVSPMGVDLEQYEALPDPSSAREQLGLKPGMTVGYAGHLYEGRGLELIVELAQRNPEIQFLWVGGEPDAAEAWRQRLSDQGVGNIQLVGFVSHEQLPRYQAACEILLMPYARQISGSSGGDTAQFASPMKAFEYMASGRAILASNLPVLQEVLDEEIAVLLPPEDEQAWDQALKAMLQQPEWRILIGAAARARAGQYTWRARAERSLVGLGND